MCPQFLLTHSLLASFLYLLPSIMLDPLTPVLHPDFFSRPEYRLQWIKIKGFPNLSFFVEGLGTNVFLWIFKIFEAIYFCLWFIFLPPLNQEMVNLVFLTEHSLLGPLRGFPLPSLKDHCYYFEPTWVTHRIFLLSKTTMWSTHNFTSVFSFIWHRT